MVEKLQRSFLVLQKFYKTQINLLYKFSDYIEFWGGYYESSVFIVSN